MKEENWFTIAQGHWHDFWWDFLGYRLRNLKLSIKNMIRWFPIIWKDRDWDDSFIFAILKQKLTFQADYIAKKNRHVQAARDAERMRLCVKLIDIVVDEHYSDVVYDQIEEKYGKSEWVFTPIPGSTNSRLEIKHPNIENGTYTEEQYSKEYKELMGEARDKEAKAKALLFKILDRHILGWWD